MKPLYLLLKAGDLVALRVDERPLRFTGDDITGLLGQWQQLANFFQTFRLSIPKFFLWR